MILSIRILFEYSNTSAAEYSNPFFPTNPSPSSRPLVFTALKSRWDADDALEYSERVGHLLEINRIRRIAVTWRLVVTQLESDGNEFECRASPRCWDDRGSNQSCPCMDALVIASNDWLNCCSTHGRSIQSNQSNLVCGYQWVAVLLTAVIITSAVA